MTIRLLLILSSGGDFYWRWGGGRAPKAQVPSVVGARIKAPREVGCGETVSPLPLGDGSGEWTVPPPQKIFGFLSSKRRVMVHSGLIKSSECQVRTRENYAEHVQQVADNPSMTVCFGVKQASPLHQHVQHFHVVDGLAPDACHDLMEGVVPAVIALWLSYFIQKRYFTLAYLNKRITCFLYKMADKTNCPQHISDSFHSKGSVGGNMSENLTLIHMLPFLIGDRIPDGDLTWDL